MPWTNPCYRVHALGRDRAIDQPTLFKEYCEVACYLIVSGRKYRHLRLVSSTGSLLWRVAEMKEKYRTRNLDHKRGQGWKTEIWPETEFHFLSAQSWYWPWIVTLDWGKTESKGKPSDYSCVHCSDKAGSIA